MPVMLLDHPFSGMKSQWVQQIVVMPAVVGGDNTLSFVDGSRSVLQGN